MPTIKEVKINDVMGWSALFSLCEDTFSNLAFNSMKDEDLKRFKKSPEHKYYKVFIKGKEISRFGLFVEDNKYVLNGFIVYPMFRGKGYGYKIIKKLIDEYKNLQLYTSSSVILSILSKIVDKNPEYKKEVCGVCDKSFTPQVELKIRVYKE